MQYYCTSTHIFIANRHFAAGIQNGERLFPQQVQAAVIWQRQWWLRQIEAAGFDIFACFSAAAVTTAGPQRSRPLDAAAAASFAEARGAAWPARSTSLPARSS